MMRRALLPLLFVVALLPVSADAARRPPSVCNECGFAHARHWRRTPVLVQNTNDDNLSTAMGYWNAAANWDLLRYATETATTEVFVAYDTGPSARWSSSPPYASCTIEEKWHRGPTGWIEYAHELGHCLGWDEAADRYGKGVLGGQPWSLRFDHAQMVRAGYEIEHRCAPRCRWG